ncbi:hypothetical protein SVIOM74S_03757 [Streptomyces violarus]
MADHLEASVTLPSDPASVSAARAYVVGTLAEWGLPADTEVSDSIRLIISELATNAVQHTFGQSPTFTVDIALDRDEHLRIGVDGQPPTTSQTPACRRPAGQRPRSRHHPLADRGVRRQAQDPPHPRGRQDHLDRTPVDRPGP